MMKAALLVSYASCVTAYAPTRINFESLKNSDATMLTALKSA